ncbi:MAG: DUF5615 family PIN-like protein [Bacteroidota bacterium]|nr:DUF5615 family PIN-like protein [Bacteroidota bacterium]
MKFKLDENFGTRTINLFRNAGYDVLTVFDQKIEGIADQHLYEICCKEKRSLVTLDLDFSSVIKFPPIKDISIIVFRIPKNPTLKQLENLVTLFLQSLTKIDVTGKLLIVEIGRIRIHQTEEYNFK